MSVMIGYGVAAMILLFKTVYFSKSFVYKGLQFLKNQKSLALFSELVYIWHISDELNA